MGVLNTLSTFSTLITLSTPSTFSNVNVRFSSRKPFIFGVKKNWLHRDHPTDGPTDRRTDTPSYREARTHLKIDYSIHIQKFAIGYQIGMKSYLYAYNF